MSYKLCLGLIMYGVALLQERKRVAVLEEQQRRIQEAMASKPPPSEDNFELKAMKAMGAMEEGDAVFGSGAEVNLDSQVVHLTLSLNFMHGLTVFLQVLS